MARPVSDLAVSSETAGTACLLIAEGVLDTTTYLKLRDAIIKAALDEPRAVLVDVNDLGVTVSSAWSVFTSARWHVSTWPDVTVILVCGDAGRRRTIASTGVTRYVPVYPTVEAALGALTDDRRRARRRARAELPASLASLREARGLVAECLGAWSQVELIPVATVIVNVFVENVLQHTACAP
ncbi:MAG TPA: STAS domain-containing protein, partial [Mycobacterium sp.]|nr:STAS domain-containing protein [Mycobacterium sp.]